jgi:hypothetical protein
MFGAHADSQFIIFKNPKILPFQLLPLHLLAKIGIVAQVIIIKNWNASVVNWSIAYFGN